MPLIHRRPIPTLASNSKLCLDKELQIHRPAASASNFLTQEQPDKSLESTQARLAETQLAVRLV